MPGVSLGYRRGSRASYWVVRRLGRLVRGHGRARYRQRSFAFADDQDQADGERVLSYEQARARAVDLYVRGGLDEPGRKAGNHGPPILSLFDDLPASPPYTFAHAAHDYLKWRRANDYHVEADYYNARAYALPDLGEVPLKELTRARIWACYAGIVETTVRVSMGFGARSRTKGPPPTADERRRRMLIANRILYFVCSVLDYAYSRGEIETDFGWRRIKRYRGVNIPRDRHLNPQECRALLIHCDPDLRLFVKALLLTGCRFGELQRLCAKDFDPRTGHLRIHKTKKRVPRTVSLTPRGRMYFAWLCTGKEPDELVFVPRGHDRWTAAMILARFRTVAKRAQLKPPINATVMRHTYASQAVMAGIPLNVVAKQLGHSDTRTLERHYAHLSENYVDELIGAKMPNLA